MTPKYYYWGIAVVGGILGMALHLPLTARLVVVAVVFVGVCALLFAFAGEQRCGSCGDDPSGPCRFGCRHDAEGER